MIWVLNWQTDEGQKQLLNQLGKALSMRHRELNLMRLKFLAICLRNLDLLDTSVV